MAITFGGFEFAAVMLGPWLQAETIAAAASATITRMHALHNSTPQRHYAQGLVKLKRHFQSINQKNFLTIFIDNFSMNSPRFHLCLVAALAASDLSGCARLATSSAAPECRETVDDDGTLLKFCETDSRLTVELVAAAPQPLVGARPRLIDDPKVLAALRREALNKVSRKPPATPVALVCAPGVNEPAQSPSVSASLAPTPIIEDQAPTQVDDPAFAFTNRMN